MTWVSWRLQRTEALVALGILALAAALLIPTGLDMAGAYDNSVAACVGKHTFVCNDAIDVFRGRFEHLTNLTGWLNLVPGLIGILLAAPLLLELEQGTYRLAWTQSITRRRWIAGKLGLAVALALAAGLVLVGLMTWWRRPLDHVEGRLDSSAFDFEGTVPFAYILFALGLALAVGVIWRRTVPALIAGFAGYVVVRLFVDGWVRQRYEDALVVTWPTTKPGPDLTHAWVILERPSDRFGNPPLASITIQDCARAHKLRGDIQAACLGDKRPEFMHAVFHPASRFWDFQLIETALFGGIAVALIAFAAWWIHDRVE